MQRRQFLKKAGLAAMASAAAKLVIPSKGWAKGPTINWRMATSWPKGFPILQTGAEHFAKLVEIMSNGQMHIDVFAANEKVNALKVHEAVGDQTVECGSTVGFYWAQKVPAAQWFSSVPFGLKAQDLNTWYYEAGGKELWEEVYADFNLIPMVFGNSGIQMGGWFNREINRPEDFTDLRMRIAGLGGQVMARLGAKTVVLPPGEIVTAFKQGKIDAAEWVGPYHDALMGFPAIAKYYYAPGWQEMGSMVELVVNRKVFEKLPHSLKQIIRSAAAQINHQSFCSFEYQNQQALQKMMSERKVQFRLFPHHVLRRLERTAHEVLEEQAAKDPMARKVHNAYQHFQEEMRKFALLRGADIRM